MNVEQRRQLSIDVAKMYYIDKLSQDEIAKATGMSRSNISRILNKCVADGIVEIHVNDTISSRPDIARKLALQHGLQEVIIVPTGPSARHTNRNAGTSLAAYLLRNLKSEMLLGVGKGASLYYASRMLENTQNIQVDTVQLMGGTLPKVSPEEGQALVSAFAFKLHGTAHVLHAPLMVRSKLAKQTLLMDPLISEVVEKYKEAQFNIFEIETPYVHAGDFFRESWLTRADALQLSEVGVAACVCGYYYDQAGAPCNAGIHDRVMAVDPHVLFQSERNIGVALGKKSLGAVRSIIANRMLQVLLVDEELAFELLQALNPSSK